jgi:circadian clock protein KaiC
MKRDPTLEDAQRCSTGISGLDAIIGGGLPKNRLYLLQGEPGTGKTTLAFQFLLEGARRGEKGLYISFSETRDELQAVADSHGWDLKNISLLELSSIESQLKPEAQNTVFHPFEVEMNQTTDLLLEEVKRVKPTRVVFDSVSELRMLAETSLRYRRQMLALKQFFAGKNCTVILLDDLTTTPVDLQVRSIVHGVVSLHKLHPEFGEERRRLSLVKLRGVKFSGGYHDYIIKKGGLSVFPRNSANTTTLKIDKTPVSSGIKELDHLLCGGLDRGTSNLFLGPAGTGKSTLSLQYAYAAVQRGENVSIYCFEESIHTLLNRTSALGIDLPKYIDNGLLTIQKIDHAQLSPGEFSDLIRTSVLKNNTRMVVIDSLNGYIHAMPQEQFLTLQLHELFAFLGSHGIVTLLVLAQQGIMGATMTTPVDLTYLADTVLITRYFEALGAVKKAVSVLKKRGGAHESTIREFSVSSKGIQVGAPLAQFRGVLTGTPEFLGKNETIMGENNK